jgi:hypothetical protein
VSRSPLGHQMDDQLNESSGNGGNEHAPTNQYDDL